MFTPFRTPIEERLFKFVQKSKGCWLWTGCVNQKGYGVISAGGKHGGTKLAHRVSWEIVNGPVPAGLNVLHKCDNPICVRPFHLFLGTINDNNADRDKKGRCAQAEQHYNAKVTEADVRQIRKDGRSNRVIGLDYGISESNVRNIKKRRTWKRVC